MHFFWRLKQGDNLSKSSFLEALLGLEFGHADFADDADFLLCCLLVPQISRIYTDFFWFSWRFREKSVFLRQS